MTRERSTKALMELFNSKAVINLSDIKKDLGDVSDMTAFRYLKLVNYRRSYNHNSRYYCLYDASNYDRLGLWSWKNIHFSVDGSLRNTVRRMVYEATAGAPHAELQQRLQVRVQNTLVDLFRKNEIYREKVDRVFIYLHSDSVVRRQQLERRKEIIISQKAARDEVDDRIVIEVLLALIHHPGLSAADAARRLRGRSPPISFDQVQAVFKKYDLDNIGEKGGPC